MMLRHWLPGVALVAIVVLGCAASSDELHAGCKSLGEKKVSMRLVGVQTEQIDGSTVRVGRFEATSRYGGPLYIQGWKRDFGFLVEYPAVQLQVRTDGWKNVVPMIGSFHSEGNERTLLAGDGRMILLARIEFGVPEGVHEMRVVVRTTKGACLVSDAFFHTVPHR